jgi:hypothetical protein
MKRMTVRSLAGMNERRQFSRAVCPGLSTAGDNVAEHGAGSLATT